MNRTCLPLVLGIVLSCSTQLAFACTAKHSASAHKTINVNRINQSILSKAILAETNAYRCRKNRNALRLDNGLNRATGIHANNMAKARKLSHTLNAGRASKLTQRFKLTGVKLRGYGSENLQTMFKIDLPAGFYGIKDASACKFTYTGTDKVAPEYTYARMAKRAVAVWAASPGHRKNLLSRKARRMGADAGFSAGGTLCGTYYLSQNFAG